MLASVAGFGSENSVGAIYARRLMVIMGMTSISEKSSSKVAYLILNILGSLVSIYATENFRISLCQGTLEWCEAGCKLVHDVSCHAKPWPVRYFRTPIWKHTASDEFTQCHNENPFEYILPMYTFALKPLVTQSFAVFCRQAILLYREWHQIDVCYGEFIVRRICLKKKVHGFTVQLQQAFLLTLTRLRFEWAASIELDNSTAFRKEVEHRKVTPSCTPLVFHSN